MFGQNESLQPSEFMPAFPSSTGLIPSSVQHLFQSSKEKSLTFYCSFIQIYNEHLYDLLQDPKRGKILSIRESKLYGIFVEGLAEFVAESIDDCFVLINRGNQNRAVRQTRFNHHSSRSHTIFQMSIESDKANKKGLIKKAKLNFCDLAGSEKYDKENDMVRDHIKELTQINKSLSALGKVIHALGTGSSRHIPYRDSKLTRLLQDSLGVNTRTILIATVSPVPNYVEETISTLKFADRAKQVMVKIKRNEISATNNQLILKLQKEIQHLKTLLNLKRKGGMQELEQKIWVLTEENQKLKNIGFTVEEVERLKVENKKLRIELQQMGTYGNTDGFYYPTADDEIPQSTSPFKGDTPKGSRVGSSKPSETRRSNPTSLPPKASSKVELTSKSKGFCDLCNCDFPCIHSAPSPFKTPKDFKSIEKSSSSPFRKTPSYRSAESTFGGFSTPNGKSPEPRRMNVRYRMTNCIVEDTGVTDKLKEVENRKKEMRNIQARLNKITELENYRKEQFKKEIKALEENRKREEEETRRKMIDDKKKKKDILEKKKVVEEFKRNKKISEEIEQLKAKVEMREAEDKRRRENEMKKKKVVEYYSKKKQQNELEEGSYSDDFD